MIEEPLFHNYLRVKLPALKGGGSAIIVCYIKSHNKLINLSLSLAPIFPGGHDTRIVKPYSFESFAYDE
jgi:hypothetical protein